MYKKYVHPSYNWHNKYYIQIDDNTLVDSTGEYHSLDDINSEVAKDIELVKEGKFETVVDSYGLLESSKVEFESKVYDTLKDLKVSITSSELNIKKIQTLTGVFL